MTQDPNIIAQELEKEIKSFSPDLKIESVGKILEVGDGIALVEGLFDAKMGELLAFPGNVQGLVLNLNKDSIGVILLGDYRSLKEGDEVKSTGQLLNVGVGEKLLGRVVNPLGEPLDNKGMIDFKKRYPIERIAPGVIVREPVDTPLQTGIISIDSMIPIGRGQRELIIGDRGTGKSSIALTTVINQNKTSDVICIYVMIGQKSSFVAQTIATLEKFGAMKNTIIVAATANDPAALQYLAPYAGTAIGEYFAEKGKDALIVYDDLSKHAWSYRELSLLLRRPSGREAYPGDVFYLHSRLLERSVKYSKEEGGGSLTALPIIETQASDLSAYIPTNVISITDGQIYLEADLFNAGFRPAINAGLSVSRVGSSAQIKAMKQVAGRMRIDLAQYRELAAFAQFSSDLDKRTREQLERGQRITELLKQGWDEPMAVEDQVLTIWSVNNGYLDQVQLDQVEAWRQEFIDYVRNSYTEVIDEMVKEKKLSDEMMAQLAEAATKFNQMNESKYFDHLKEEKVTG